MMNNWSLIRCRKKNKDKLMSDCKSWFLKDNPKFKGLNITQNFMLEKVIDFYLDPKV